MLSKDLAMFEISWDIDVKWISKNPMADCTLLSTAIDQWPDRL
jgi:hypothetical protein